jgi:hypothetical protein
VTLRSVTGRSVNDGIRASRVVRIGILSRKCYKVKDHDKDPPRRPGWILYMSNMAMRVYTCTKGKKVKIDHADRYLEKRLE